MNPMQTHDAAVAAVLAINAASTPAELDAARLACWRAACDFSIADRLRRTDAQAQPLTEDDREYLNQWSKTNRN